MLTLAIETATERASAALLDGDLERAAWESELLEDLCRHLATHLADVVARGKAAFSQLDLVAIGLGPGSFTSLRIGLATAKAIAISHDVPLVGVSSLAAMAWQMKDSASGLLCPALDAKRGDLYAAVYRATAQGIEAERPEFVTRPDLLGATLREQGRPVRVFGHIPPAAIDLIEEAAGTGATVVRAPVHPAARAVAELSKRHFESEGPDDPASLRPIYLRKSYAEEASHIDLKLS